MFNSQEARTKPRMLIEQFYIFAKGIIKTMDIIEINNAIYESVSEIKFAVSNLACVRISIKGNEDMKPAPETLDDALCFLEQMIDREVDNIYKLLIELDEKKISKAE